MKDYCMGGPNLLGSHGNGSVQKYSASSASLAEILCDKSKWQTSYMMQIKKLIIHHKSFCNWDARLCKLFCFNAYASKV